MKYIIIEVIDKELNYNLHSLKDGVFIGVYDNLMLLSKHLRDKYNDFTPNDYINSRQNVRDELEIKGKFHSIIHTTRLHTIKHPTGFKSIIVVNSEHMMMEDHDFYFIKEYKRNGVINQLLS